MSTKSVHFRLSSQSIKDLEWLGKKKGGLDRTNTLRLLIAEAKARQLEEMRAAASHPAAEDDA